MITRMAIRSAITVLLISFIFVSGCKESNKTINEPKYEDITAQEAYTLIQDNKENTNFVILDVRTPEEYASGHLENAVNINFNSPSFQGTLNALDKDKTYLLHCRTGMRSSNAYEMMKSLGFKMVYHMAGGIVEWENNGLPTVQ